MDKILFLMNVDWNWIKQRPHFLAEELSKDYEVIVINQRRYKKNGFQNRTFNGKMVQINTIPRIDRYRLLKKLNTFIKRNCISRLIKKENPEYIFLTLPDQIKWIPKNYSGKLIYDCMDDHIGLSRNEYRKIELRICESELVKRSNYLFSSSAYLSEILIQRYGKNTIANKLSIVRNAFGGSVLENVCEKKNANHLKIAYFGTISDWFDFEIILKSLDKLSFISYVLIGPLHRGITIPNHERINYIGTVEHEELYEKTKDVDVFIMPFKLDESIKAVDPVKLYEYINCYKDIICVEYAEVKRFSEFVYFYNDIQEYENSLERIFESKSYKYDNVQRKAFLLNNSWEKRAEEIIHTIRGN